MNVIDHLHRIKIIFREVMNREMTENEVIVAFMTMNYMLLEEVRDEGNKILDK